MQMGKCRGSDSDLACWFEFLKFAKMFADPRRIANWSSGMNLGVSRDSALPSAVLEIEMFGGDHKRTLGKWENE